MEPINIIGNLAFILVAGSLMVRDMLWLRALSVCSSCCAIVFNYYIRGEPIMVPIYWNVFFISLNFYHIKNILFERRSVTLSDKEKELYETQFQAMTKVEFMKLLRAGEWIQFGKGEKLIAEGHNVDYLYLIYNGKVGIELNDQQLAHLKDGQFVGEMSFLTNKQASADVVVEEETECLCWKQEELKGLMKRNPSLLLSLQSLMSSQVSDSLINNNKEKIAA